MAFRLFYSFVFNYVLYITYFFFKCVCFGNSYLLFLNKAVLEKLFLPKQDFSLIFTRYNALIIIEARLAPQINAFLPPAQPPSPLPSSLPMSTLCISSRIKFIFESDDMYANVIGCSKWPISHKSHECVQTKRISAAFQVTNWWSRKTDDRQGQPGPKKHHNH